MNKYQSRESRLIKKLVGEHFRFGFSSSQYRRERRRLRATVRFAKMMPVADYDELPRVVITRTEDADHE